MVQHSYGDAGRYLNGEWHEVRHQARTETFNIEQWGDIDRERFDLDTVEFDRKQKQSSYVTEIVGPRSEGAAQPGKDWSDDPEGGK